MSPRLVGYVVATLLGLALVSVACRTSKGGAPREAQQLTLAQVADEPPSVQIFERVAAGAGPGERRGFVLAEPAVCQPLPEGRACGSAAKAEAEACAAAGGTLVVCEDCSRLCSVALLRK